MVFITEILSESRDSSGDAIANTSRSTCNSIAISRDTNLSALNFKTGGDPDGTNQITTTDGTKSTIVGDATATIDSASNPSMAPFSPKPCTPPHLGSGHFVPVGFDVTSTKPPGQNSDPHFGALDPALLAEAQSVVAKQRLQASTGWTFDPKAAASRFDAKGNFVGSLPAGVKFGPSMIASMQASSFPGVPPAMSLPAQGGFTPAAPKIAAAPPHSATGWTFHPGSGFLGNPPGVQFAPSMAASMHAPPSYGVPPVMNSQAQVGLVPPPPKFAGTSKPTPPPRPPQPPTPHPPPPQTNSGGSAPPPAAGSFGAARRHPAGRVDPLHRRLSYPAGPDGEEVPLCLRCKRPDCPGMVAIEKCPLHSNAFVATRLAVCESPPPRLLLRKPHRPPLSPLP